MARLFLPREWRIPAFVWFLFVFEFPFTVANLTLFGVASPNLYRTILWNEGARMGFNSDQSTILYAYANYRPVDTPLVWSNFNTQYHLVIGVVCLFFYLLKATMWLLHIFLPIFSVLLHIPLLVIWAYGLHIQTAPDTIDPEHSNPGAPWYITQHCAIVDDRTIRSYCMQAKASFAVSVVMAAIYAAFLAVSFYSLIPTRDARRAHAAKQAERRAEKEEWEIEPYVSPIEQQLSPEEQWQHMWELQQLPRTPGPRVQPMTPRSTAFADLEGGRKASGGNPAWYGGHGGAYGGGGVAQQPHAAWTHAVSPVQEQDEFGYYGDANGGKGKGTAY